LNKVCRIALVAFLCLYGFALIVFAVGILGLFGAERDPLSGVFLVLLGLPWNRLIDVFPEAAWPWLAAAAPVLNILVLWFICRVTARRNAP
jgi:hypothetical protein